MGRGVSGYTRETNPAGRLNEWRMQVVIGSEWRLDGVFLILYSQDQRSTRGLRGKKNQEGREVWSRESGM